MHLNPSELLTDSRPATRHGERIPPPAFLSRDLHCDWDLITTVHANLMLIGSASQTGAMLDALSTHFRGPTRRYTPKTGAPLPQPTTGTLIVAGAECLDPTHQAHMLKWLHQLPTRRVQVVCTASQPLFPLVQAGHFLPELYYRLNVVLLEVPPE